MSSAKNTVKNQFKKNKRTAIKRTLISIITPVYNEEDSVNKCYMAIKQIFENTLLDYDYEHIFCDNGSKDHTVDALRAIAKKDKNVKVILNSRNFGVFRSMFNGLLNSRGDAVVPMLPVDLQDPVEVLPQFIKYWEKGYDIVYGQRINRSESAIIETLRKLHYRLVNRMARYDIPHDAGEYQLIDKKVVEVLRQFDDCEPYIRGMIAECGFKTIGVSYRWGVREKGESKTSFFDMINTSLNGLVGHSQMPIRACLFGGLLISFLSFLYGLYQLFVAVFFNPATVAGIPTLIVGMFFLSGINLFFLGLMGEYVVSIHAQVRKRPLVIEEERINF